ncbi:hypothetical protein QZH41_004616 [Actinostola sp. cb2023]|nr:hypothetical protein QZH41_004616 [Actinostola sp. cb2023]
MKPEQQHSRQIDSRSQFPPRPDQRPSSFQVDHKPFKPEQQSQIPVRPGRQPMDPPRPEQRHPSTFQPGQQPPKPFRPEPHHLPAHQIDGESSSGGPTLPKQKDLQSFSQQNLQLTDRTSNAQSYPETGAFLASQSSLVGCGGRPTPSLLSQGSRPYPSTVTSTDYLTSFSVAAAQTQLSQYQNSSSQQQTQQFQQQLLLQQQQLILQQQEMLKQQQTQHSHESDQVQIGLLLQQVLQQQKQLTDLEMKMKDKNEHEVEHKKHDVDSAKSTEDLEQAPRLVHYDDQAPGSKASEDEDISSKAVQSVTDLPKNDKLESKPSHSTTSTFVPNYEAVGMSHWFTDLANKHLSDLENTNSKELNKKTSEDSEDEHDCNKDASEDIVTSREDNEPSKTPEVLPEKELHEKTHEAEISDTQTNFPVELKKEEENPNEKVDSKHEEKFDDNEESKVDETKKEEETSDDEETEETHQPDIEDQIKQIKELQQRPQQHLAGYLYEPGSLPTGISSHNEPTSTEQDDDKPDDESLQALVSAVKGFDLVVKSLSAAKHGTSSDGFSIEWRELERLQEYDGASMTAHAANMNQPKNRYTDILPCKHVVLTYRGVPESPADLLAFIVDVRSSYQRSLKESEKKPIIIHCSAGIGRTGTFIIVYSAMEEFNGHQEFVNIPRLVRYLRLQRKYMVQRREQYEFCYKTVLFYARQYLDLELASMSMKRKTGHKPAQLASEHVTPSTSSMDDAHSNVPDEEPSDSRKKSPGIRFLGELKSDDSLEEDEIRGNEKVTNEQSISEKYCKGTLETDSESTKTNTDTLEVSNGVIDEHGREGTAKSEECRDKGTEHEGSSGTSTQDIGIVSIGEHKEVRYAKVDEDEEDRNVELEYKDQDIESKGSEVKDDEGQINASVADCLDIKEDQCDSTAIDTQDTFDADSVAENKSGVEES